MCVFVFMFIYYIEAEAMDRHFEDNQLIFLNENICISINISPKCSQGTSSEFSSIGSDNGLTPTRRLAIIWTSDVRFTDAYGRHSALSRYISILCYWSQYHPVRDYLNIPL